MYRLSPCEKIVRNVLHISIVTFRYIICMTEGSIDNIWFELIFYGLCEAMKKNNRFITEFGNSTEF